MMKACQIPEEKAANMTTDALLASVLDYPLLASHFTYDHPEDYCDLLMVFRRTLVILIVS